MPAERLSKVSHYTVSRVNPSARFYQDRLRRGRAIPQRLRWPRRPSVMCRTLATIRSRTGHAHWKFQRAPSQRSSAVVSRGRSRGSQPRIARRVLDVFVAHVGLDGARILAIVRQLKTGSMAQHVGVHIDAEIGFDAGALNHAPEAGRRQWCAARSAGQGADLLEKRGWDDRPDEVGFASYSASSSLRTAAI